MSWVLDVQRIVESSEVNLKRLFIDHSLITILSVDPKEGMITHVDSIEDTPVIVSSVQSNSMDSLPLTVKGEVSVESTRVMEGEKG